MIHGFTFQAFVFVGLLLCSTLILTTHSAATGLYGHTSYVHEVSDSEDLEKYRRAGKFTIVVYYASWCPHCKLFVGPYTRLAEKCRTLQINFLAVNCMDLPRVCSASPHVKGYPAIVAYNIPPGPNSPDGNKKTDPTGRVILGDINMVELLVERNALQNSESDQMKAPRTGSMGQSNQTLFSQSIPLSEWSISRESQQARIATPTERLLDALASLDYLLMHDLFLQLNEKKRDAALLVLETVVALLPAHMKGTQVRYARMHREIRTTTLPDTAGVLAGKLHPSGVVEPQWTVCGVSGSSNGRSGGRRLLGRDGESFISSHSPSVVISSVTRGYTCGLWTLLHFITVSAAQRAKTMSTSETATTQPASELTASGPKKGPLVPAITISQVLRTINVLVDQLFGCSMCREHFLAMFNSCRFGRKKLDSGDATFEDLQYWLFRSHDAVTRRITVEYAAESSANAQSPESATASTEATNRAILRNVWPSPEMCRTCSVTSTIAEAEINHEFDRGCTDERDVYAKEDKASVVIRWNRQGVIQFLQSAYWDEKTWKSDLAPPTITSSVKQSRSNLRNKGFKSNSLNSESASNIETGTITGSYKHISSQVIEQLEHATTNTVLSRLLSRTATLIWGIFTVTMVVIYWHVTSERSVRHRRSASITRMPSVSRSTSVDMYTSPPTSASSCSQVHQLVCRRVSAIKRRASEDTSDVRAGGVPDDLSV